MPKKTVLLKRALLGFAAIVVVFVGVVASRPNTFKVERSATIAAPASAVFAQVNDFHKWQGWSPWEKMDPAMKKTFEGASSGTGAIYGWDGNNDVGAGKMTLTESKPDEQIRINLEFTRPFAGTNLTVFSFKPEGNQTTVTWAMSGEYNFISKAICMFMDMDKMVGGDFEKGLAQMKAVVETPPAQANAAADSISR